MRFYPACGTKRSGEAAVALTGTHAADSWLRWSSLNAVAIRGDAVSHEPKGVLRTVPPDDTQPPLPGVANDEIVMVPVPRSQLAAVYAALGRRGDGPAVPWEAVARGAMRSSGWLVKEVVVPAARSLNGEDVAETVGKAVRSSIRALLEGLEPPDSDSRGRDG